MIWWERPLLEFSMTIRQQMPWSLSEDRSSNCFRRRDGKYTVHIRFPLGVIYYLLPFRVSISNFQKEFIQQNSVPFAALVNQERKAPIFITITKRTNSTSNVVQAALSRPSTRNLQEVLINHGNCYIDFGTVKCLDKVKHNTTIKIKLTYITFQHGILSEKEYSTEFEDWSTKIKVRLKIHWRLKPCFTEHLSPCGWE